MLMLATAHNITMGLDSEENGTKEKIFTWSVSEEVAFLKASKNSRPVGIKKHWEMATLVQNMHDILGRSIDPEKCWQHLGSLYALDILVRKIRPELYTLLRDTKAHKNEREELPFSNEREGFSLPAGWDLTKGSEKESENTEEKPSTPKIVKDYSRVREKKSQANKKNESGLAPVEKVESPTESDEEDSPLIATKALRKSRISEVKKSTPASSKKETPKRGARSNKESSEKRDSSPAVSKKSESEEPKSSSKKEAGQVGKRTLRSRGDDDGSSSSAPTPPPTKRARRI